MGFTVHVTSCCTSCGRTISFDVPAHYEVLDDDPSRAIIVTSPVEVSQLRCGDCV